MKKLRDLISRDPNLIKKLTYVNVKKEKSCEVEVKKEKTVLDKDDNSAETSCREG